MHPVIHIGPVVFFGYGLMLALSFSVACYLFMQELKRKALGADMGVMVTLIALLAGLVGAKLFYLFENWGNFLKKPVEMIFSPSGLTFYGGFLLATLLIYFYLQYRKVSFLRVADCTVPSLLIAYGIARIGCQLAGDGDYGFPTTLPWGTDYSAGTYPPSLAFRDIPAIASQYPAGVVPDHTLCHPTPIYEFAICALLFWLLWRLRGHLQPEGKLLMLYLVFAGLERFFVEFLRISPRIFIGLTEAQLISVLLVITGISGWYAIDARLNAGCSSK